VSAEIEFAGLEGLFGKLAGVRSGVLQREMVEDLHRSGQTMLREMDGYANTPIQNIAMRSVHVDRVTDGIEISGGGGGGLPATLFPGAEFGGQRGVHNRRRTMVVPVFGSRPVKIKKRATLMFKPNLGGGEGYFFYRVYNEWEPKLIENAAKTVARVLGR
jgi:hypothetical protein